MFVCSQKTYVLEDISIKGPLFFLSHVYFKKENTGVSLNTYSGVIHHFLNPSKTNRMYHGCFCPFPRKGGIKKKQAFLLRELAFLSYIRIL
jgi:hypothetical protein